MVGTLLHMGVNTSPVESVDRALRVILLLGQSGAGLSLEHVVGKRLAPRQERGT